jgi:hypothetical protein
LLFFLARRLALALSLFRSLHSRALALPPPQKTKQHHQKQQEIWTHPAVDTYDVFDDATLNVTGAIEPVRLGAFELGNHVVAGGEDVLLRVDELGPRVKGLRGYVFATASSPEAGHSVYLASLNVMVNACVDGLVRLERILTALIVVEIVGLQSPALVVMWRLLQGLRRERVAMLAALVGLPGALLRSMARRPIVLEGMHNDDDDDGEAGGGQGGGGSGGGGGASGGGLGPRGASASGGGGASFASGAGGLSIGGGASEAGGSEFSGAGGGGGGGGGGRGGGGGGGGMSLGAGSVGGGASFAGGGRSGVGSIFGMISLGGQTTRAPGLLGALGFGGGGGAGGGAGGRGGGGARSLQAGGIGLGGAFFVNGRAITRSSGFALRALLPLFGWLALVVALYADSRAQIARLAAPIATLNACAMTMARASRTRLDATRLAFARDADAARAAALRLADEVVRLEGDYRALVYGGPLYTRASDPALRGVFRQDGEPWLSDGEWRDHTDAITLVSEPEVRRQEASALLFGADTGCLAVRHAELLAGKGGGGGSGGSGGGGGGGGEGGSAAAAAAAAPSAAPSAATAPAPPPPAAAAVVAPPADAPASANSPPSPSPSPATTYAPEASASAAATTDPAQAGCFPVGHPYHDVTHAGIDRVFTRFVLDAREFADRALKALAEADAVAIAGDNGTNPGADAAAAAATAAAVAAAEQQALMALASDPGYDFIWRAGAHDLFDGMELLFSVTESGAVAAYDKVSATHAALLAVSAAAALCWLVLVYRPLLGTVRREAGRAARAMCDLPRECDIERSLARWMVAAAPSSVRSAMRQERADAAAGK